MSRDVHIIDHPLVQHKLTLMRQKDTSTKSFRQLAQEISTLLAYEITRDMPMQEIEIETPLEKMKSRVIDGKKIVLASILRAGNGFLDGMLQVLPSARVGHIGLYRDHETLEAVEYFFKAPSDLADRLVIVVDPMLDGAVQPSSVDLRVDRYFRVFRNDTTPYIDPKEPQEDLTELVEVADGNAFILHPGEFVLGSTLERVALADDLV